MRGELILIFDIQSTSGLHSNHGRRVVALIAKFRFAGDWICCRRQRDRRDCLRKVRKYSVLPTGGGHKETDASYVARGAECDFFKDLHKTFPSMVPFR